MTVEAGIEVGLAARIGERFWVKVDKKGPDDCWLWKAHRLPSGYGTFSIRHQKVYAHRIAVELDGRRIPPGMVVDHHVCDNPPCVNPRHLRIKTSQANTLRGTSAAAVNARATHCPMGHEYTPENTYGHRRPTGAVDRECRICVTDRVRRRYWAAR